MYLRDISIDQWNKSQADNQFQGKGMSHELAALLLTETVQYSLNVNKNPIFIISLDALSAYDKIIPEIFIRDLFFTKMNEQALLDQKLKSRLTFYEWDKQMMGPTKDNIGFEQGGICSSDYYKIYGKNQLITTQASGLGVDIGSSVVSSIGLADDTVAVSDDIYDLQNLLRLIDDYCHKYKVTLVPSKTKLICMGSRHDCQFIEYCKLVNPVMVCNTRIDFSDKLEHVGVVRSVQGNMSAVSERITAQKRAVGSILSAGLGRGHLSNPQAGLRVYKLYGQPTLYAGLSALYLTKKEISIISSQHDNYARYIQRFFKGTPRSFYLLVGGSLPGVAVLHQRQFSLFGMICRLPENNPLLQHAVYYFSSDVKYKSWFQQIEDLCFMYKMHSCSQLISLKLDKESFKKYVKLKIVDHWQIILRKEAQQLKSLKYFKPHFYSLLQPSKAYLAAGNNRYEIAKLNIQLKMLSGRYRTSRLSRFWSDNKSGNCTLGHPCVNSSDTISHILVFCPCLEQKRSSLKHMWLEKENKGPLNQLVNEIFKWPGEELTQFLLDPLSNPMVISLVQEYGSIISDKICYLTRTFCFSIHRERQILLGTWYNSGYPAPEKITNTEFSI